MKLYKCDGCGEQVCVDGPLCNNNTCEVMYEIHAVYQLISSETVNKGNLEGYLFCNNCVEKLLPKRKINNDTLPKFNTTKPENEEE